MKAEHLQKPIKVAGHLDDRRGIYHISLSWCDENGKRGRKSFSTGLPIKGNKKRAEEMLQKLRKEQEALLEKRPNAYNMLFADFMEHWLDVIKPDIKLTTFGGYQMNVKKVIGPYFRERGITLNDLAADDINEFYELQLRKVKATSVHKYHANIGKALKYAVLKGYIEHSIMDKVKRPKPERFVGKFLRQSEVVKVFEAVKGHKLELGVIIAAFYGLRRGEVVGLRWSAIDFDANTISIEHTVTVANIDGQHVEIVGDTTKSKAGFRTLPLAPQFRERLLALKAEQERCRKLCGKSYNKAHSDYIYVDQLGNRIKPGYLTTAFPEFMEKNGFRRMRFHDLRHTSASLLIASGVPLKQVQEWLGHSDFAVTANTYAHLEFNSKLNSANAMTWIGKTSLGSNQAIMG